MENFTKGMNPYLQIYMTSIGMLHMTVEHILKAVAKANEMSEDGQPAQDSKNQHTFFDILGELLKYNQFNYVLMNSLLVAKKQMTQFHSYLIPNIINSNVLIRSCFLTDFYIKHLQPNTDDLPTVLSQDTEITKMLANDISRIYAKLLASVTVKSIHYDSSTC